MKIKYTFLSFLAVSAQQEKLICTNNVQVFRNRIGGGQKPIGCCPPDDPDGRPYGPEKSCCCNKVYRPDQSFCCQPTGKCDSLTSIMKLGNEHKCEPIIIDEPLCQDTSTLENEGEILSCSNSNEVGSFCSIECVDGYQKVNMLSNETSSSADNGQIFQCVDDTSMSQNGLNFDNNNNNNQSPSWSILDQIAKENECCRPSCPPVFPIHTKADFFIVIDKSSSIELHNFAYVKQFMLNIIDTFPLGPDRVQVRMTTFNSIVEVIMELEDSANLSQFELEEKINNIVYDGKGTNTGDGLMDVVQNALHEPTNRPHVPDFLLLITDGRSKQDQLIDQAVAHLKNNDVTILTIGVGDKIRKSELASIATAPRETNMRTAKDFAALVGLGQWVMSTQCPELSCN